MNKYYNPYPSLYSNNNLNNMYNYQSPCWNNNPNNYLDSCRQCIHLKDYGPEPYVVNIEEAANQNYNYRLALWTGTHLQLTLMSINAREDIGLEVHPNVDQFIRIEEGEGLVMMGDSRNNLWFRRKVSPGYVILIPAGTWHNVINTGCTPLKLYSIYAPPAHPHGTIEPTKPTK
jgi:mannose-6-phosphate isomerase-like protein (cupin superfamily)